MKTTHSSSLATLLDLPEESVVCVLALLDEGATVPFIARYRKERTGSLNEVEIFNIQTMSVKLKEFQKRKEAIIESLMEQGKLTDELTSELNKADTICQLEDIYLPFRPRKKTRADIAREKGLEPLAKILMTQNINDPDEIATRYLSGKVESVDNALQGARDIMAEWINENGRVRRQIRKLFSFEAVLKAELIKGKEETGEKFRDYFAYEGPLKKCPSHRVLAIRRGEKEGVLRVKIYPPMDKALDELKTIFIRGKSASSKQVEMAIKDAYKRLIQPSLESEFDTLSREKADEEAIRVFSENVRQLLMAAPLGPKRILAIDPGYRTGCKVVCLDETGGMLTNQTIYPHKPQQETSLASKKIASLVGAYKIQAIAIGNGTAGRETEAFIKKLKFDRTINVYIVSEDGASIYSASPIARKEFPEYDVTVRGAISIGRRLMDPLAELIKIDPKSIGVGQYQYDVNQIRLKEGLDNVVVSCVNNVGVNLNTASEYLLTYISGLGPQLARNILTYRKENGTFKERKELLKVGRLGAKAYEQCAGFLRIHEAENPLDNTAVHPESYPIVEKMAKKLKCSILDLVRDEEKRKLINPKEYITSEKGLPTILDILEELAKPGRDPRKIIKIMEFDKSIRTIEDIKEGMILPGIVTNITNFGAFVDIGIKENGLIHVSNIAQEFVNDPSLYVKVHQHLKVKVLEVDSSRKRIQLSLNFSENE